LKEGIVDSDVLLRGYLIFPFLISRVGEECFKYECKVCIFNAYLIYNQAKTTHKHRLRFLLVLDLNSCFGGPEEELKRKISRKDFRILHVISCRRICLLNFFYKSNFRFLLPGLLNYVLLSSVREATFNTKYTALKTNDSSYKLNLKKLFFRSTHSCDFFFVLYIWMSSLDSKYK
jgi:hypothetical protein